MSIQRGRDLLLKLDDGTGAFVSVIGLKTRQLTFNAEAVDVTHAESVGRWRELLAGAAVRRAGVTGAGIFCDEAADALVRQVLFDDVIRAWQVVVPSFGIVQGPFHLSSLHYRGEFNAEITFELTLESAGPIGFSAL